MENIFARKRKDRDYDILYTDDGDIKVTRIDANVYPVGSNKSAKYEFLEGNVLSKGDVKKLKLDIEESSFLRLKPGQKVILEDGSIGQVEEGDCLVEGIISTRGLEESVSIKNKNLPKIKEFAQN